MKEREDKMLLFGDTRCLEKYLSITKGSTIVLNFSSITEKYPVLDILPKERFDIDDSQQFDIAFADYIMSNDYRFCQFFNIPLGLYYSYDVFVLISRNDFFDILNESLMKLIQQRYGYVINEINTEEDLDYLVEGSFSIQGLYNLDLDNKRHLSLTVKE